MKKPIDKVWMYCRKPLEVIWIDGKPTKRDGHGEMWKRNEKASGMPTKAVDKCFIEASFDFFDLGFIAFSMAICVFRMSGVRMNHVMSWRSVGRKRRCDGRRAQRNYVTKYHHEHRILRWVSMCYSFYKWNSDLRVIRCRYQLLSKWQGKPS